MGRHARTCGGAPASSAFALGLAPSLGLALALGVAAGCGGSDRTAGTVEGPGRAESAVAATARAQDRARETLDAVAGAARARPPKRILFGDLHVHSTYSIDAFFFSLPVVAGEGAHPPADACDFARYCSQLDFFSLTDHAEALTPEHWEASKRSLRACQERAGSADDPDLVALAGWEWTQVGPTPETHWGHKNVIFRDLADEDLPARPINSLADEATGLFGALTGEARSGEGGGDRPTAALGIEGLRLLRWVDPLGWSEYADFEWYLDRLAEIETCPRGVDTRDLPPDCRENAGDPGALFEKLAQWGFPVFVIPHGTTWGFYSPPGTDLEKQLSREQHDPDVQSLVEIMSGHGNSEEYRPWRAVEADARGVAQCPEPTLDFLPCCWRAGEIMRERCGALPADECNDRVAAARQLALEAGVAFRQVFPDASAEDWLDCDQCRDCFKASLGYRPKGSVQYAMALSNFEESTEDGRPLRFRWGFLASSDNHTARPGTGYKQYERRRMTEATGPRSAFYDWLFRTTQRRTTPGAQPDRPYDRSAAGAQGLAGGDAERVASFLYPGGLAAVHADGRSREAVWDALQRGEVYGTSGPRLLLWFDLLNAPEGPLPMGAETALGDVPRFEVRAVGAFVQKPGCSEESRAALSPERLEYLCRGECYHPSDERHRIVGVEVVRVRPQATPGEPVDGLIEDPWRRFDCPSDPAGCVVRFEDPEFPASGRDALYYVRAIQEETPAVNGANLRTEFDAEGQPVKTTPCYGGYPTDFDDDCLAPLQERAWSSPIYVNQP